MKGRGYEENQGKKLWNYHKLLQLMGDNEPVESTLCVPPHTNIHNITQTICVLRMWNSLRVLRIVTKRANKGMQLSISSCSH